MTRMSLIRSMPYATVNGSETIITLSSTSSAASSIACLFSVLARAGNADDADRARHRGRGGEIDQVLEEILGGLEVLGSCFGLSPLPPQSLMTPFSSGR